MKFIHTGDWHIGKIVNEFSMIEEQKHILELLITIIKKEKPNALIIAGDLYDRSIPPVEAVELLDKTLSRILLELQTPILLIRGNHDSATRVSFAGDILTEKGLHIAGAYNKEVKKVTLEDIHGSVNFYLIPYIDPRELRHILQDDEITTHDDAMKKIIDNIKREMNKEERNVIVAHGYVTCMNDKELELELSDSERPLSIGGTDIINGDYFECFDYTALGHLHGAQKVGSDKIRYAGSILKYSFSEVKHNKSVTLIEMDAEGKIEVEPIKLMPKSDMRIIKGPLSSLIDPETYNQTNVQDYVYAILTDEGELIDPISKLRAVYPNIMGLSRENIGDREESRTSATSGYQNKTKLELFKEFYQSISNKDITDEKLKIIKEIIEDVEKEEGIACDQ